MTDINAAEKQAVHATSPGSDSSTHEKAGILHEETAHEAAARGHLAADQYGIAFGKVCMLEANGYQVWQLTRSFRSSCRTETANEN